MSRVGLLLVVGLGLAGCRTPASPGAAAASTALHENPPPGVATAPPDAVVGHYALTSLWHQFSSCSQSWDDYTARTSLVMDLGDGGDATACRGKQVSDSNPDGHFAMREQQGFRGSWRRDGEWIEIRLDLDPAVCPQIRGYTNREPEPWHLRCVTMKPDAGSTTLPGPVLACQFATRTYTEELGYKTFALGGEWVLLATGNGLRVHSDHSGWDGDKITIEPAPRPVQFDEWTKPF